MFGSHPSPSVSELETVLHVLSAYVGNLGTHADTFGENWEQIMEYHLNVQGSTRIPDLVKKIKKNTNSGSQTTKFTNKTTHPDCYQTVISCGTAPNIGYQFILRLPLE